MDKLISHLLQNGIYLSKKGDKLSVEYNGDMISDDLLKEIKNNKDELLKYLGKENINPNYQDIIPVKNAESFALSNAQRRLWILSQFEGVSAAYNMPGSMYLNQDVEIESFKRAIESVIERHEILRTVFKEDKTGEIRQWVLEKENFSFEIDYKDFRKAQNKEEKVKEYITEDSYKIFDLVNGPLLRAALLRVEDSMYVFCYNMHHIISDGWSLNVLSKDVFSYYNAYKENKQPQKKKLRIHYKDYSAWQLTQLKEESFIAHRRYWLDSLSGELPTINLPGTNQRPQIKTSNGQDLTTYIGSEVTDKLKKYSQANGGSLFMGLLAVWNILMYRYTSQKDIIIGTPVAGREHTELEDQIGFYVNMLALRAEVNPKESFNSFYQSLKEDILKSYSHQMYPFDRLVEELNLQRDTSRNAVFDVLLDFHNNGEGAEGLELSKEVVNQIVDRGYRTSKFDIEVIFRMNGDYLSLQLAFNTDVYEKSMVEGLIRHYKQLLNVLLETPEEKISTIDYLPQEEKHELLVTFNDTAAAYPKDKTIVDLFEEQVEKTPDNIAVIFAEKALTYRQLSEKSNQLAAYLQKNYDIQPDNLIGIHLDRSEWMIVSILGVLKSGAAYVPIDPEYPSSRKEYIIKDSAIDVLITETNFIYDINYYQGEVFAIDVEFDSENSNSELLSKAYKPGNLAYVMYTSGSTGMPKGVMVEHASLINYLKWAQSKYWNDSSPLNFGLFTSLSFDLTVTSIYLPLISGGALNIFNSTSDVSTLLKEYFGSEINSIKLTPAHISLLEQHGLASTKVQVAIVGGDKLHNAHVGILRKLNPAIRIYNEYGPTESTVGCTIKEIEFEKEAILIGCPIANTQIYILSENEGLQPAGVAGEICIGGDGLARGYLNQEALTKEKFIANPFKEGARLYKTGDLGRWLADGNIEFIGRKDDQVKIRGYRIEPGEIEHALEQNKEIDQAVVLTKENESGEKELVAYITSNVEQNTNDLRAYLKETLPAYMIPACFVQVKAMPLTANGKIDKKSLSNVEGPGLSSGVAYVAPGTEQEKVLALVWSDVLKREGIGIRDSFYNLGGDSIKSIQVVARLKQQGYRLKVEHLLRTPVLEELARSMELTSQVSDQSEVSGEAVLTPIQEWFFKSSEIKVHDYYNQSVLLYSNDELDRNILEKIIDDLTRHHDALRMIYKQGNGGWQQFNQDTSSKRFTIDFYDLRESDDAPGEMARVGEALQSGIMLSEGPLLKVLHFRLQDGDRLGLIIHHLVVDGVSWRILLEDLSALYSSYKAGEEPGLPSKTDSFQRWALLQKEYAAGKKLENERTYWQQVCDQQIASLAQDKVVEAGQAAVIDSSESFGLDKQTTELLQTRVHGVYNTEINDVLLTGFGLALKEVLSADKSVLKMEGHGREEIIDGVDISRTVGWFTTLYPFVLDVSSSSDQAESLVAVKEDLRRVPNKGIGYGILTYLSQQGLASKLTTEITFNYLGDFGANVSNDADSLFEYASERIGSDVSKENTTDAVLDVSGMLVRGELGMSMRYSSSRYDSSTISKLAKSYKKHLQSLIETLSRADTSYLTPSDLTFKGLSQQELSKINPDNTLEDVYELSPLQEGIYYHWLAEASSSLYFEQISYRVRAETLDIEKLKGAYDQLTARHAVLRTGFSTEYAGRSLQIVRREVPSNFTYEKLDRQAEQQALVETIKQQDRDRGFDLSSGSQMRLHVIDLSAGEYEFIWSHHHILMDGWCVSVLINDFNELLSAAIKGSTLSLPPVMPYSNYINWLKAIDRERSLSYWKDYLTGYSSLAEIPFKAARAADSTYVESSEHLQIGGDRFRKIDALCSGLGITHNTFVQGVWGYLLSRYNNTNDVVFGAVVSGRPAELAGVEDMIGLFINTIPVRVKYDPDDTPVKLLKSLQEQSIRSTSHHYMNLSEVQSQSELGMELINHIMIFENYAVKELESEGALNSKGEEGLAIESREVFERTNYDFNVIVSSSDVLLSINIKYNLSVYDELSLKNLMRHFDKLINEFAQNENQSLKTLDYLSEEEKHKLLVTFNDTAVAYPNEKTIVDLFEEQAAKTPDNIAIVFEDIELTYQELNERSNQLAHYLRDNYDIEPDDLVGIKQSRSEWMIVSILGVLKAGGAYVPIDPDYPQERIDYITEDTHCKVCLDEAELSKFKTAQERYPKVPVSSAVKSDNLVYVIYTSGSTGKPKGVMVKHYSFTNLIHWYCGLLDLTDQDAVLLIAPVSFDLAQKNLFASLTKGGRLCLSEKLYGDYNFIAETIKKNNITVINSAPSAFYPLLSKEINNNYQSIASLNMVVLGGEPLNIKEILPWTKSVYYHATVINSYGPTECTDVVSYHMVNNYEWDMIEMIPIGKPVNNTELYVLDEQKKLLGFGLTGEIHVGGVGVSRGYLNNEKLTSEKFVQNPFKEKELMYNTGDIGRWLPDGSIEFIGRKDDQVKIRGQRIELGEIEHALLNHEEITQAVVLAKENQSGEKELVGYITSPVAQSVSNLRDYLKQTLPVYMLPAYFVQLEELPLNANGKIDKKSLPAPEGLVLSGAVEYVAPRNEIEERLVKIWEEVLQRENIGVKDDFFALGGHSLKALKAVFRVNEEFKIGVKVTNLFNTSSIEDFAILIAFTLKKKKNKIPTKEVDL